MSNLTLVDAIIQLEDNVIVIQFDDPIEDVPNFKKEFDDLLDKYGGNGYMVGSSVPGLIQDPDEDKEEEE